MKLLIVFMLGCSGGGTPGTPDAWAGAACPAPELLHDGGNLIFERLALSTELAQAFGLPEGTTEVQNGVAYFMDLSLPDGLPPASGTCTNVVAQGTWPLWVGDQHTDLDAGSVAITGKRADGTTATLPLAKAPAGMDRLGRHHDIYYQSVAPPALDDSLFTVELGGGGVLLPTTLTDALYLPPTFAVTGPGLDEPTALAGETTVHWTPATPQHLPANAELLALIWLLDTNGIPTHLCAAAHAEGQFTITGATVAEFKQIATARGVPANRAVLVREAAVDQVVALPNGEPQNPRRFDLLGLVGRAQLVTVP